VRGVSDNFSFKDNGAILHQTSSLALNFGPRQEMGEPPIVFLCEKQVGDLPIEILAAILIDDFKICACLE
jgi:hypothetical protein